MNTYHGICRVCRKFITIKKAQLYVAGAILHKEKSFFALSCNLLEDRRKHHSRLELIKAYGAVNKEYGGTY